MAGLGAFLYLAASVHRLSLAQVSTSTPLLEFNRVGLPRELAVSPTKTGVKKSTNVTVKVNWPSKESSRKLPDDLEPLGKMLLRRTYKQMCQNCTNHLGQCNLLHFSKIVSNVNNSFNVNYYFIIQNSQVIY